MLIESRRTGVIHGSLLEDGEGAGHLLITIHGISWWTFKGGCPRANLHALALANLTSTLHARGPSDYIRVTRWEFDYNLASAYRPIELNRRNLGITPESNWFPGFGTTEFPKRRNVTAGRGGGGAANENAREQFTKRNYRSNKFARNSRSFHRMLSSIIFATRLWE